MARQLIMCMGLPGSGKTTWALDQVAQAAHLHSPFNRTQTYSSVARVNKDDIRRELEASGWTWSRENEAEVVRIRDARIRQAFWAGATTVISDDTNLDRKHKIALQTIATEQSAEFVVKRFDTPIEECIRRDSLRDGKARVGEDVIRRMAKQYGIESVLDYSRFVKVEHVEGLPEAIICDLDGTLALHRGRSPYDTARCFEDKLNWPVATVLNDLTSIFDRDVIYLSGREDRFRDVTTKWLNDKYLPGGHLFMRPTGDFRKDWIVKGELFDAHVRGKFNVLLVLDDRTQVVKMWRAIGLTCFQVAEGDF